MALPKIDSPIFMLDLPSTKETIKYRPFTVKEEKILLIASQSEDEKEISSAIEQIINNCLQSEISIASLTSYDIEYLFINLRAKSVNNVIDLTLTDEEDGIEYPVQINLDDLKVKFNENHDCNIVLNAEVTLIMKDASYNSIKKLSSNISQDKMMNDVIVESIDQILVGDDEVLTMKEHTKKEQQDFIDSFSSKNMRDIEKFFGFKY